MKSPDVTHYISGTSRARRRRRFVYWLIFIIAVVYVLFMGLGALTLKTGIFRAKEINITGNKEVPEADIRASLQAQVFGGRYISYLLGFNNLLIWPDRIQNPDRFLPQIKSMDVEKSYWSKTITVRVTERSPYGIWCVSGKDVNCFWFDEGGKIFKKGPLSQGSLIKTVIDSSGRKLGLGEYVLSGNYFKNLHSIFEVLDSSNLSIDSVELKNLELGEVTIKADGGPELYFSLRFKSDWVSPILKKLMDDNSFPKLKYVDFRIENRAYYK